MSLALADERRGTLVDDIDFALDRDDMRVARPVDQIHERRHQRPLAARPGTGDEHESLALGGQFLNLARQPELLRRNRSGGHDPEDPARPAVISETHTADASEIGKIADPFAG